MCPSLYCVSWYASIGRPNCRRAFAQAAGAPAAIRIGTRQQTDELSTPGKRAPGFGAIDQVAALSPDLSRFSTAGEGGHVRARIRLSHGYSDHQLARRNTRQPPLFLGFCTTIKQGSCDNLWS